MDNNGDFFTCFYAFGHTRSIRRSMINNQLKHALGMFISFVGRFLQDCFSFILFVTNPKKDDNQLKGVDQCNQRMSINMI